MPTSSEGKRLPVSAGWKDRALKAEAEVERLSERVRDAMLTIPFSDAVERGETVKVRRIVNVALADDEAGKPAVVRDEKDRTDGGSWPQYEES